MANDAAELTASEAAVRLFSKLNNNVRFTMGISGSQGYPSEQLDQLVVIENLFGKVHRTFFLLHLLLIIKLLCGANIRRY